MDHTFRAGFLFYRLGAGGLGFLQAVARLGPDRARFENVGGIDNDELALPGLRVPHGWARDARRSFDDDAG